MMMDGCGIKVVFMMILIGISLSVSSAELSRPPQPPQHNYAFNKFRPPPPPEPTFIQRITSWFFPWGGVSEEEEYRLPASPKIDDQGQSQSQREQYGAPGPQSHYGSPPQQQYGAPQQHGTLHHHPNRINPVPTRDTEPTTARTTQSPQFTKCSPCNKIPWIPMMPTYQMPLVKPSGQQEQSQQQVYFKHEFNNANQYQQVNPQPGNVGYKYRPPATSTHPPSTTPIKFQDGYNYIQNQQGHQYYGVPPKVPPKNVPFQGYNYNPAPGFPSAPGLPSAPAFPQSSGFPSAPGFARSTTFRPNTNTIDTSVITFTTGRTPQNNRPSRFTAAGSVTNPEYILPPNVLPLEGENSNLAPIPIPNLSPTPIPPLFDAKPFHDNPYRSQTGFIKLVPLEPVAQLSSNVNVQMKPERNLPRFEAVKESPNVEVISSNLVAEFTIPAQPTRYFFTTRAPVQQNYKLNLDFGNNLDASNTTVQTPVAVESATDNAAAGSEHDYEHNINQALEAPTNYLKHPDDDIIRTDESNRVVPHRENLFEDDSDEETTTEGNYIVKFEPSIQTAADLAEKAQSENVSESLQKLRNRPTPFELLDSPSHHATFKPKVPSTEAPPPFRPIEDYTRKLATLWTSPVPITFSTEATTMRTYRTTNSRSTARTTEATVSSSLAPVPTSTFPFLSDITPPREPPKPIASTKKPKQIQIVIPYTTYHKPSPFKNKEDAEVITYRTIRGHYLTHPTKKVEVANQMVEVANQKVEVIATNIDPVGKKVEAIDKKPIRVDENYNGHGYHNDQEYPDHAQESKIVESKVTIAPTRTTKYFTRILANNIRDLLKKEKTPRPANIDLIKLQKNIDGWTEQSFKGKASTISLMGHTKAIPRSFLSTTARASMMMKLPTTTLSPRTTFDPDLMAETKRQYDNILYKRDDDPLYVKRHDRYLDRDFELVLINNNLTGNYVHEGVKVFAPKTTLTPKELWKRLHLTVSPITNERIYVVTPQPPQEADRREDKTSTFRPRFAVRPTIGGIKKQSRKLKPELFEKMEDGMNVETVDRNSKLVRIITPEQDDVTSSMEVTSEKTRS